MRPASRPWPSPCGPRCSRTLVPDNCPTPIPRFRDSQQFRGGEASARRLLCLRCMKTLRMVEAFLGSAALLAAPRAWALDSLDERIATVFDTSHGLCADDVARRASETSPDVRAKGEEREAATARVDAALLQLLPRVTLSGRYTRLSPF